MWVRTESGEMVNLDHSHHVHYVEHGTPKFNIEVVADIGHERYILAHIPKISQGGREMAVDYIDQLLKHLDGCNKVIHVPQYPRPGHR